MAGQCYFLLMSNTMKTVSRDEFNTTIARMNAEFCDGLRSTPPTVRRAFDIDKAKAVYGQNVRMATRLGSSITMLAYW